MAINLIDGKPGSGKTFYAVNHLATEFYNFVDGVFVPKHDFVLISNIDDLKLPHTSLTDDMDNLGLDTKGYFAKAHQQRLYESRGEIIYLIDEAQFFFDRKFYDKEVFNWFQYHRHYGQTVYLTSQNAMNLPKDIIVLVEVIISAQPRSLSISSKLFYYHLISNGQKQGSEKIIAKKAIFDLYCSAKLASSVKVSRPWIKPLVVGLLFAVSLLYFGYNYLKKSYSPTSKEVPGLDTSLPPSSETIPSNIPGQNKVIPLRSLSPVDQVIADDDPRYFDLVSVSTFTCFYQDGRPPMLKILYNGVHSINQFRFKVIKDGPNYFAYVPKDNDRKFRGETIEADSDNIAFSPSSY